MTTKQAVDNFLQCNLVAIAGVSRDKRKFGYKVYNHLKANNYKVFPINPSMKEIDSDKCYPNLTELKEKINGVILVVPPFQSEKIVREAKKLGLKAVWFQRVQVLMKQ